MSGKRGLIMGVANDHSIAWGIAKTAAAQGAKLAFTYQSDSFAKRVEPLANSVGASNLIECDVSDPNSIDLAFKTLKDDLGKLDFVVHAIAYSDKEELKGRYVDTSQENFLNTMNISCYSFTAVARRAAKMMNDGGSMVTLTYHGAQQVMPNYNVMGVAKAALEASVRYLAADLGPLGIRVNAISAGPMRTLAGSAVGSARQVYNHSREVAPLRRNVVLDDIGGAGLYLLSDLSGAVTGEVHYVDCGFKTIGMPPPNEDGNPQK
ncbi:MAG: enoyl-[acyl-carrier-protein] reductase FabI [Alphaproteobacteria bacterium]|nr:enoyl-[acyl-carrier-protein] reductase FabI [Alphaproteobacteria bacterium]